MAAPVDWTYPVEPPGWLSRQKHKKHLTASCAKAKKRTSRKLDGSLLKGVYAKYMKMYFSRSSAFECVFNTCRSFGAWTLAVPDLALRGILWITWLGPGESTSISTRALYSSAKSSSSVNQELLRIGLFLFPDIFLFVLDFCWLPDDAVYFRGGLKWTHTIKLCAVWKRFLVEGNISF